MRLLRLRLKDFRGVVEREVSFLPRGVTLVQGANESGKTTLADAIDLLFDKRDTSIDRVVRAAQPVGRDVGSEVELEAESGAYRFRYFKRFNRQTETVLRVLAPAPEELTGRPAHERAEAILRETLDLALWRALRVDQGVALGQGALGQAPSLLAALDRASTAGPAAAAGPREEALFERVTREVQRYFTPGRGQATGELRAAEEAEAAARAALERRDAELARVEADAERAGALERRIVVLRGAAEAAASRAVAAAARSMEIGRLAAEAERRQARLADEEARRELLGELQAAEDEVREVAGRLAAGKRTLAEAEAAHRPAAATLTAVEEERRAAEEALAAARGAEEGVAARERLAALRRDRERMTELEARRATLAERLGRSRVTEGVLRALEDRERTAERALAALEGRRAGLTVTAWVGLTLDVAGEEVDLGAGDFFERQVSEPLVVNLPGVAEVRVTPGGDVAELRRRVEQARAELAEACQRAGVADLEGARIAHREWRQTAADLQGVEAGRREVLAGRRAETLAEEIAVLEHSLPPAGRAAGAGRRPAPADRSAAGIARQAAEAALATARERLELARRRRDDFGRRLETARAVARELEVYAERAAERLERVRRRLATRVPAAGAPPEIAAAAAAGPGAEPEPSGGGQIALFSLAGEPPPADLGPALSAADRRAAEARAAFVAARRSLAEAHPEGARREVEEADAAASRAATALNAGQGELRELHGRLQARGEQGLFDLREEVRIEWETAAVHLRSVAARAAAARRLHQALTAARDHARETYGEPLRRRIVELGRPLFGADFAIELDDDLKIARRTLAGTTLDFDQLSAGAREQLALLSRLAAALLAGGVPLILDDGLGWSDPERLAAMGEILTRAGDEVQIIVLTCFPDRYRHVRGAKVVEL